MSRICAAVVFAASAFVSQSTAVELVFAEDDGIQLLSIPQPSPGDGYIATKLQARATDPAVELSMFTNISISNVHQVWPDHPPFSTSIGTAQGPPKGSRRSSHSGLTHTRVW